MIHGLKDRLSNRVRRVRRKTAKYLDNAKVLIKVVVAITRHRDNVILIATPTHGNLGDQAIVYAQYNMLSEIGEENAVVEITKDQYMSLRHILVVLIRKTSLVIIDGGGNIGTLWPEEDAKMKDIVARFSRNPIVIFPQTIFFEDSEEGKGCAKELVDVYSRHSNLLVYCRDEESYGWMKENAPKVHVKFVPDIVLSLNQKSEGENKRRGALFCFRTDKEKTLDDNFEERLEHLIGSMGLTMGFTSTISDHIGDITKRERESLLNAKWREFSNAEIVLTDRLHAMIFCAITATPCIAFDNISHKVSAGYYWLQNLPYIKVAHESDDVGRLVRELLALGDVRYGDESLDQEFANIRHDISEVLSR